MSLANLLNLSSFGADRPVTKEEVDENLEEIRARIAFYREYPDIFVEDVKGPDCPFHFSFTQRVFLRAVMRHKYVYCVFPRGFSKSFLSIMALILKAILFPGSALSITTGGKERIACSALA